MGMAKSTRGAPAVVAVCAQLVDERLQVDAVVRDPEGREYPVRIPDRELATMLPRSILAADGCAPATLLATIKAIVERMVVGRQVRLWEYRGHRYLGFFSWRPVRFSTGTPPEAELDPERLHELVGEGIEDRGVDVGGVL